MARSLGALFAYYQDVNSAAALLLFYLYLGLLLIRVDGQNKSFSLFEFTKPAVALALPCGYNVMVATSGN